MGDKILTSFARPDHPTGSPPRNGKLIESPDSWRKIRKTTAMVYRENVRSWL